MLKEKAMLFKSMLVAAIAVLAFTGCQQESLDQAGPVVVRDSVASTDSVMIYYEAYGEGDRAVVFVHGWCGDRSYWVRQIEAFKDEYPLVTIDLAGHGESGSNREDWTVERFGDDVAAVVNALGYEKVALVGHSMGGTVCIEAARRLPEKAVVLIGADTHQDLSRLWPPDQAEAFIAPFKDDFVGQTREYIASIFDPNADSTLVAQVVEDMVDSDPAVATAIFENLFAYDSPAALADMRKPIRSINSDRWETDLEGNRSVAASFEVEIIPGVGHFPQLEDPAAFNLALRKVLHEFWPPVQK